MPCAGILDGRVQLRGRKGDYDIPWRSGEIGELCVVGFMANLPRPDFWHFTLKNMNLIGVFLVLTGLGY
jgi:hypothetical protein